MEILLLSTCGLVANHYIRVRRGKSIKNDDTHEPYDTEYQEPEPLGSIPIVPKDEKIGVKEFSPVPAPLGVRTLKTHEAVTPGYDQQRFDEQFFPQDPNPQILEKPWKRMIDAPYKPKEEVLNDDPTPQDIRGHDIRMKVNSMEENFAKKTVISTSEKQFDRPVEQIATGNGSMMGFHYTGGKRHHKFILNDQPTIETEGGPRGAFAAGGKSDVTGEYRTTTQRASLNHESVGPPVAIGVPQSSAPVPSFEISASHMESWRLDDHAQKGSRAPVPGIRPSSSIDVNVAHDEKLQVLDTSLVRRGERFGTGASGNRETLVHVPKNNDFIEGFDDRVMPNFKIGKASDRTDQEVRIRNKIIPELSQNVSALKKNRKPPVSGDTAFKSSGIDTMSVSGGTSSRGLSLQAASIPSDAFRTTDKKELMGEAVSTVRGGASSARLVSGMKSNDSQFRTTNNLSETVSLPLIRGSGGQSASGVQPLHIDKDTSLSEVGSFHARSGVNNNSRAVNTNSMNEFNNTKEDISAGFSRKTMLASKDNSLPGGLAHNPTGSITASNMDISLKNKTIGTTIKGHHKSAPKSFSSRNDPSKQGTTKNRRMGEMLNSRLGSSTVVKKLLKNPYSMPAASRMPSN